MTTLRRAALLTLACLLLAPAASAQQGALVTEMNRARDAHGLAPMAPSPSLMGSASGFAGQLMRSDWFGHASSIDAGGGFRAVGEVLRLHQGRRPRYAATVRAWLASPSHRAVVLNSAFTHVGAGRARGRFSGRPTTIWVLHLGAY